MTYEQWTAIQNSVSAGAVFGFVVVDLMTYFMSKRPPDEHGKRKGRPWLAALAGVVAFFVVGLSGTAALMASYPEHSARYEWERDTADR